MKPKVILYSKVSEQVMEELEKECDLVYIDMTNPDFHNKIKSHLSETVGIIGDGLKIDRSVIDNAPKLKIVTNISVGYDNLDLDTLNKRKILATNTPEVLTETTADLMFTLILATARKVTLLDRYVKEGRWRGEVDFSIFGTDVHHKTLGIIGLGRIGRAIARRGKFGFGMTILYYNRNRNLDAEAELEAEYCTLDDLLRRSDFVCLMTPLTEQTYHLIGEREFSLMKESAIFINGSRGNTVDEKALVEAIRTKQIAAAGLDVYQQEPIPKEHPLLQFEHVVTLPHAGSNTIENKLRMDKLATKNLLAGLRGEKPPSLINPEVFESNIK